MKLQVKAMLLLFLLVGVFIGTLIFQSFLGQKRLRAILEKEAQTTGANFNSILQLKGSSQQSLVTDYTFWDEMVDFVHNPQTKWAQENLDVELPLYKVNVLWVYDQDARLVYSVNNLDDDAFKELSFSKKFIEDFSGSRFCRYFKYTPKGLMEIRGATIHPTADSLRKTPPQGYFLAGVLWDDTFLKDLAHLTGSSIKVFPAGVSRQKELPSSFIIRFARTLYDINGAPLARLEVSSKSEGMMLFTRAVRQSFLLFFIFTIAVFTVVSVFFFIGVSVPLQKIVGALKTQQDVFLGGLLKNTGEFGAIARLIQKFFQQKNELTQEVHERRRTEKEVLFVYGKLKETQAQLVQSAKMASLGQLAGGVAHEINNPLTGVLNNVQLIKMIAAGKEEFSIKDFKELLDVIEDSAVRCKRITQSLLDFSRASKGIFLPVSLNETLEKLLALVEREFSLLNIAFQKDLQKDLPMIFGDPQLLQQVVFDIVSNAKWAIQKKAGQEKGLIAVKSYFQPQQQRVCARIADNGIGIPKDELERIFEPFYTTKPVGEGTGLGLSIVYNIVKTYSGTIDVESEPGKGAAFTICLPVFQEPQQQEAARQ